MNVGVLGCGHMGLITALSLGALGHVLTAYDVDDRKIRLLERGAVHFYEGNVREALEHQLSTGALRFTSDPEDALGQAQVVFICVSAPSGQDGEIDVGAVDAAARNVARHCRGRVVVAQKSTVPVGTARRIEGLIGRERRVATLDVAVVANPEFLREGSALQDAMRPSRIVVGAGSAWPARLVRELYAPMVARGTEYIETDRETAELSKLAANAFLALKVSFANALARVSELCGADVVAGAEIIGSDPRIGREFLQAGLGFGGYCLPKDVMALKALAARLGYPLPLLSEVLRINEEALEAIAARVEGLFGSLRKRRVALLGLSFKPGTDDVRSAPALALARRFISDGASVVAYDPRAGPNAKREVPELEVASDAYTAATAADCLVICTEWAEFRTLDLSAIRALMAGSAVVDGRNVLDPRAVASAGLAYFPAGRPKTDPLREAMAG